jgi:hypothetical protein
LTIEADLSCRAGGLTCFRIIPSPTPPPSPSWPQAPGAPRP